MAGRGVLSVSVRVEYKETICPIRTAQQKRLPVNDENAETHECESCGKKVSFQKVESWFILKEVSCSRKCEEDLGWFDPDNLPKYAPPEARSRTSDKPAFCPECGGPSTRGRGWSHKEGCQYQTKKKEAVVETTKESCPDCDGPARGRGWTHNPNCPALHKVKSLSPAQEATYKQLQKIDEEAAKKWKSKIVGEEFEPA